MASPDGESIFKVIGMYSPQSGAQLTEGQLQTGGEATLQVFKAIEAYILANPYAKICSILPKTAFDFEISEISYD